ncbi:MAG: nickel pincer cofactor biosynthesis protein LarC [Gemmataceae bacterium]|nr:nickel pincer cofactor biosynthesis protein LarC [Gemmataceae bacterium]
MRVAHFDCFSGISGDMTLAALFDAGVPTEPVLAGIASLGLPVQIEIDKVRKGGFAATQIEVLAPPQHEHRFLPDVEAILGRGSLTAKQRDLALRIFRRLAEAEAAVHGLPLNKVHFHEVGALDSIADIAGAAIALDLLGVEKFTSASVPTGFGTVQCEHGVMPVPTPATAELLKGVPLRPSTIPSELTTPTGAAILTTLVSEWTESPAMTVEKIGIGAGRKEFREQPNILRLFVGHTTDAQATGWEADTVWVLETNLDDVPGQVIGHCFELLFAAGAMDVFTTSIQMKKNRPGVLLSVLVPEAAVAAVEQIIFRETRTLGIRRYAAQRHVVRREVCSVDTPWGQIRGKWAWHSAGPPTFAPEYDDCARVARQHGVPLAVVFDTVKNAIKYG